MEYFECQVITLRAKDRKIRYYDSKRKCRNKKQKARNCVRTTRRNNPQGDGKMRLQVA